MELLLLSGLISFLSLDITIAFQILVSSPIFSCPLIGWILGDVWLGFEVGFLFQLLWLGRIPAGAYIVPEGNIASMLAAALVLLNRENGFPNTTMTIVFVEAIGISYFGSLLTLFYRKLNGKILNIVEKQVSHIRFKIILLLEASSMFLYFSLVLAISFFILMGNQIILPEAISAVGAFFEKQLVVVKPVILGIGVAAIYPILSDTIQRRMKKNLEKERKNQTG
jgi:mannose/fructose/N-acetylgalactosamine-specific phosphotransferase system component IIC